MARPRMLRFDGYGPDTMPVCLSLAAKAIDGGRVVGPLVLFTDYDDPDASSMRDVFTKATDFDRDFNDDGTGGTISVFYHHGLDKTLKNRRIGRAELSLVDGAFLRKNGYATKAKDDEAAAVWATTQLDMADRHNQAVYAMAQKRKVGYSSGSVHHLVSRKSLGNGNNHVDFWPLAEASITPTPARTGVPVQSIKSLGDLAADEGIAYDVHPLATLDDAVKAMESLGDLMMTNPDLSDAIRWRVQRISGMIAGVMAEAQPVQVPDLSATLKDLATLRQRLAGQTSY